MSVAGVYSLLALLLIAAGAPVMEGQSASARQDKRAERAEAYYHYAMGHLYAELATAYGNKAEYLNKAIEHYRQAIKADPNASLLSEELSDLYIQSGQLRTAVLEAEEALKQNPNDLTARRILGRVYTRLIGDPRQSIKEEMLKKAIEQYQKISERDPRDLDTWLMLGRLQKLAQNSVEAEKAYKKALELDAENEDALGGLALVYSDLGDTKNAAEMLRRVTERNPSLRTLTALASVYEQAREYALAAETLKKALELSRGSNPEIRRALAQNLLLSEQFDESLKIYEALVAEDPKDVQSLLRISQIHRQRRDFVKAREASDKARQLDPNNLEIQYNEVGLLEAEGRMPEAIAMLKGILASTEKKSYTMAERGNRVALLERLGLLYRSSDQVEPAVAAFRAIAELDAELGPRAAAQIVETYRAGRDFRKAEREAADAVSKYPDDRMLRLVRANLWADLGRWAEAAADLKKLAGGKEDREIYLALAQVYEKGKNFTEMARVLDAAEKLSENNDERESVLFMRGAMYEKMKRYDDAEAEFRKVLELNPDNASALNYLGYMFADRNVRLAEAEQLIVKALDRDPGNPAYLDSLGWVYFRQGRLKEAEEYLLRALARYARDAVIHDHLGDVFYQQGRLKEAIAQWEKSLKEWANTSPSENDPAEVAKVQKKLEGARVRLAKETSGASAKQQ